MDSFKLYNLKGKINSKQKDKVSKNLNIIHIIYKINLFDSLIDTLLTYSSKTIIKLQ